MAGVPDVAHMVPLVPVPAALLPPLGIAPVQPKELRGAKAKLPGRRWVDLKGDAVLLAANCILPPFACQLCFGDSEIALTVWYSTASRRAVGAEMSL